MGVDHEVIRQIILGTYDKVCIRKQYYTCQKWDWATIDDKCCKGFGDYILSGCTVSRRTAAEYFGLKDKSLRNLPKLKKMISDYKEKR